MSGQNVPYQLRPNKQLDREVFFDSLSAISLWQGDLSDYAYVSLGGPFLEDVAQVYRRFQVRPLYSLEENPNVFGRQDFNKPFDFIQCIQKSSDGFIRDFESFADGVDAKSFIVWLDFAATKNRCGQLDQFRELLTNLAHGDIARITMNADIKSLGYKEEDDGLEYDPKRDYLELIYESAKRKLGSYFPDGFLARDMKPLVFARMLHEAIKSACLSALRTRPYLRAIPISLCRYRDTHHQMVTSTILIINEEAVCEFESKSRIAEWAFYSGDWEAIHNLSVPVLSIRERLLIDRYVLSESSSEISERLKFVLDESEASNKEWLERYKRQFHRYPAFAQITV